MCLSLPSPLPIFLPFAGLFPFLPPPSLVTTNSLAPLPPILTISSLDSADTEAIPTDTATENKTAAAAAVTEGRDIAEEEEEVEIGYGRESASRAESRF